MLSVACNTVLCIGVPREKENDVTRHEPAARLLSASIDSTDPCAGTVKVEVPGKGILTQTYRWETPALAQKMFPQAVETALTSPAARTAGESRNVTRITTPAGDIYVGWLGGPPTWRLPKAAVRRSPGYVEVMAGWWRRALIIGWQHHEPEAPR